MTKRRFKESARVSEIEVSSTLAVLIEAERLRAAGKDVIDLGAGEPDFPTPDNVKLAGEEAIRQNFTKYTPASGTSQLRRAILDMMRRDFGASYDLPEVMATIGGKQALFNAMATVLDPGDEVLIPSPYWVTFPEIARFLGAGTRFIDTQPNGFQLTAEMLREAITPRSRMLILNSPNNPSGRIIPAKEFARIVEVAAEHDLWVISDECYLYFAYPPAVPFTAGQLPAELRSRVMISGSFSKSHSMTGWRIGFALGPAEWIDAMLKIQSHTTSNAASISQMAALEAATGPQEAMRSMLAEYERRRDWIVQALNEIEGLQCEVPEGAFYVFPDVKGLLGGRAQSSADLTRILLEEAHVAVTDGAAFGTEGHIRISYANSMDNIRRAIDRIREAASRIR